MLLCGFGFHRGFVWHSGEAQRSVYDLMECRWCKIKYSVPVSDKRVIAIQQVMLNDQQAHLDRSLKLMRGFERSVHFWRAESERASEDAIRVIMDLFYALRSIDGTPKLKDLVRLAKRIRSTRPESTPEGEKL